MTNFAALQLAGGQRLYAKTWVWGGLAGCLILAFSIEWQVWAAGLGVLATGLACHLLRASCRGASSRPAGKSNVD